METGDISRIKGVDNVKCQVHSEFSNSSSGVRQIYVQILAPLLANEGNLSKTD